MNPLQATRRAVFDCNAYYWFVDTRKIEICEMSIISSEETLVCESSTYTAGPVESPGPGYTILHGVTLPRFASLFGQPGILAGKGSDHPARVLNHVPGMLPMYTLVRLCLNFANKRIQHIHCHRGASPIHRCLRSIKLRQ